MGGATPWEGFDQRRLAWRGARLRSLVGGAGRGVVLVHGLGGAAVNWGRLAPELARRARVVVPELPGHGMSSPLPAVSSIDAFADAVARVTEHAGAAPATVIGHSLGGLVALRLALRRPELVEGLVLAGAAGVSTSSRRTKLVLTISTAVAPGKRLAPFRNAIAASATLRQLVFGTWAVSDAAALSPEAALDFLEGARLHTDTWSAARALLLEDARPDLHRLRCPALVLWGAEDRQVPVEDAFEYARRLRAPLRVVPGCGHLLIGERPDACLDAIEGFLNRPRWLSEKERALQACQ